MNVLFLGGVFDNTIEKEILKNQKGQYIMLLISFSGILLRITCNK